MFCGTRRVPMLPWRCPRRGVSSPVLLGERSHVDSVTSRLAKTAQTKDSKISVHDENQELATASILKAEETRTPIISPTLISASTRLIVCSITPLGARKQCCTR